MKKEERHLKRKQIKNQKQEERKKKLKKNVMFNRKDVKKSFIFLYK